jgi:hypothetical protein
MYFLLNQQILASFIGSLITLMLAFIVWILKSALDNHKNQINSVAKIERIYINNFAILGQNKELLKAWFVALENGRPYSCFFRDLVIDNETTLMIHDIPLVNKIVKNNFLFQGANDDTNHIYADYRKMFDSVLNGKITQEVFIEYGKNLLAQMGEAVPATERIEKDTMETLVHIRLFGDNQMKYSLFGIFGLLNKDCFPRINKKRLERGLKKIEKELEEKRQANERLIR